MTQSCEISSTTAVESAAVEAENLVDVISVSLFHCDVAQNGEGLSNLFLLTLNRRKNQFQHQ